MTNMPGAVPRTFTYALTNPTLSYALAVADQGLEMSMGSNKALKKGLNIYKKRLPLGQLLNPLVWTMRKNNYEIHFFCYIVNHITSPGVIMIQNIFSTVPLKTARRPSNKTVCRQ